MSFQRFKPCPSEHDRNMAVDMAEGAERQREADAALVGAAECICFCLVRLSELESELGERSDPALFAAVAAVGLDFHTCPPTVTRHAPCCAHALADQIRRQP